MIGWLRAAAVVDLRGARRGALRGVEAEGRDRQLTCVAPGAVPCLGLKPEAEIDIDCGEVADATAHVDEIDARFCARAA